MGNVNTKRKPRVWSGGVCSAITITMTQPIDLIKVQLQTNDEKQYLHEIIANVYRRNGLMGFYSGISASWFRQLTYTTTRFAIYESGKNYIDADVLSGKIALATIAGVIGGYVGVPGDVVTVRLQNDAKLPPDQRRNYKHVFDGLYRINREEGSKSLFKGSIPAVSRSVLITIGTNAAYDQVKQLLKDFNFKDGLPLHFLTSTIAGCIATVLTQPLDVVKTTSMNSKPGEFKSLAHVFVHVAKMGPMAFYKGFIPALLRVSPNTISTFVLYEQARIRFGYLPKEETN